MGGYWPPSAAGLADLSGVFDTDGLADGDGFVWDEASGMLKPSAAPVDPDPDPDPGGGIAVGFADPYDLDPDATALLWADLSGGC